MRILQKTKDGGPNSPVDAYFLIESKRFGSIALLKFNPGTREAYHTHAFDALTWFICGNMWEQGYLSKRLTQYHRSIWPKCTLKEDNHRVVCLKPSWAFTLRSPWKDTWTETKKGKKTTLTHGRKEV